MAFIGLILAIVIALFLFRIIGWLAPFLFIALAVGWIMEHFNLSLMQFFQIVILFIALVIGIYTYMNKEAEQTPQSTEEDDKNAELWKK